MKIIQDWHGASIAEGPKEYGWSPSTGDYTIRIFKGTKDEIEVKESELKMAGYEYTKTEGPIYTLKAKIKQEINDSGTPEPEIPIPTFQVISNRTEKDVLLSDAPVSLYTRPEAKRLIMEAVKNNEPPSFLTGSYNAGIFATANEKNVVAKLYMEYVAGANTYTSYVPTLRKTYQCSNTYVINDSIANVNRLYSRSSLISIENVPITIQGLLPNTGFNVDKVAPPFGLTNTVAIETYWGYLKSHPDYDQVGRNTWQVTVDYNYGQWSVLQYLDPI